MKFAGDDENDVLVLVTLCVRVWIEIAVETNRLSTTIRHPLREGVD